MIGFDLDGTLLTTEKKLTRYTEEVLKEAARRGIWILPVTGRPLAGLPDKVRDLPGVRYAITANGARIVDLKEDRTIYERLVPVDKAWELLKIFGNYDTMREIYYDGYGYSDAEKLDRISRYVQDLPMAEYIVATRYPVENIEEKFRQENRPVDKVQAIFVDMEERRQAFEKLEEVEGVEATGSLANNIEVNIAGVNKGEAILYLGEMLGIKKEEIAVFGDGANDISMLRMVGAGVAMENAIPEAKAAAGYVTGSNDADGVAHFIEQYIIGRIF